MVFCVVCYFCSAQSFVCWCCRFFFFTIFGRHNRSLFVLSVFTIFGRHNRSFFTIFGRHNRSLLVLLFTILSQSFVVYNFCRPNRSLLVPSLLTIFGRHNIVRSCCRLQCSVVTIVRRSCCRCSSWGRISLIGRRHGTIWELISDLLAISGGLG